MRIYRCGIDCLRGLSPVPESGKNSVQRLMKDPVYQQSILEDSRALSAELNRRQFLLDAFRSQEEDWWSHVIGVAEAKTGSDERSAARLHFAGLLQPDPAGDGTRTTCPKWYAPEPDLFTGRSRNAEPNFLAAKLFSQVGQKDSVLSYLKRSRTIRVQGPKQAGKRNGDTCAAFSRRSTKVGRRNSKKSVGLVAEQAQCPANIIFNAFRGSPGGPE